MITITRLFIDGTLNGLTYVSEVQPSEYAKYVGFVESKRVFGGNGFGSRYIFVSVEA